MLASLRTYPAGLLVLVYPPQVEYIGAYAVVVGGL
jgi:hypothetical protein